MELIAILFLILTIVFAVLYFKACGDINASAMEQYHRWCARDKDKIIQEQKAIALREARTELAQWRGEQETAIREDAIHRSKAVIVGKVTEHVAPWLPVFPYNPKDARFVGSPIDLIVFDGCDEGDVRRVIFVEIKTSSATLTKKQKQIRDAIQEHRVEWRELKIPVEQEGGVPPASPRFLKM
jgi:predicted Holliday junction resolvase-like endonuclease